MRARCATTCSVSIRPSSAAPGPPTELAACAEDYGILANERMSGTSYVVAHSSSTYLIDRDGRLRALMPYGHSADDYVHDLKILLKT